jgi:superfamily I DNA/RNA helicase
MKQDPNREILIGPPGTGKTTQATRVAYDRHKEWGNGIGYFTFTRRAAFEAQNSMRGWLKNPKAPLPHFQTIHSLCFNQLGIDRGRVFDLESFAAFAKLDCSKRMFANFKDNQPYKGTTDDDRIIFLIGWAKARGMAKVQAIEEIKWRYNRNTVKAIWDCMDTYKRNRSLLDFDDMLARFVEDDVSVPELHTIVVDEGQDTSIKQRAVIDKLRARNPQAKLLWAMDGDQAIFDWTGSGLDVKDVVRKSGHVEFLQQSYRVPGPVHDLAMRVIRRCKDRYPVEWQPAKHEGMVKHIRRIDNLPPECREDLIILARNYCYLIPYMRWLKSKDLEFSSLKGNKKCAIRVGTIHESKGLEADNVLLDPNMTMKSWEVLHTDEEKRVWYTAITRARHNLFIAWATARRNATNLVY